MSELNQHLPNLGGHRTVNKHQPWERLWWVVVLVVLAGGASLAILRAPAKATKTAAAATWPAPAAGGVDAATAHGAVEALPPGVAEALDRLRERLKTQPDDLLARKELAVRLAEHGQMVEAFEEAQRVLAVVSDDPDGLYVEGEVRITMGQWDRAIEPLDRVLAQYPDHLMALIARGRAYSATGRPNEALEDWNHGLRLAGGRYPPLERLIAAGGGGAMPPPSGVGTPAALPPLSGLASAHGSGGALPAAASGGITYQLRVDLAPGAARGLKPGTLFLALRSQPGAPPVAVKRLSNPIFPVDVTLSLADSMMGEALPAAGYLTARLDADGNVSTQAAEDLAATGEGQAGQPLTLLLTGRSE